MVTAMSTNSVSLANANALPESGIAVSSVGGDVLQAQIPAMLFSPYENTRFDDSLVISGDVLTTANIGNYLVSQVLSKTKLVITGVLSAQSSVQLSGNSVQLYIEEATPYVGYKKVQFRAVSPSNTNLISFMFDTNAQVEKINDSSGVVVSAMSKLGFASGNQAGIDAYKFDLGLIEAANKIVYGDPRDPVTYPGVAAAGAEIFIRPPLVRKVVISINVRVQTGVPFTQVREKVRNNIAALVNASPIGQSIAISDIISTVNSIPGVTAVSITSPTYDTTHDVLVINPAEKPFILDIVNDITVSKIG
jgi:hypothetical protein